MLNSKEKSCKENTTKMFASQMTAESLRVTLSVLDIIKLLHKKGVPYVLTVKLNQDALEAQHFFPRQRFHIFSDMCFCTAPT